MTTATRAAYPGWGVQNPLGPGTDADRGGPARCGTAPAGDGLERPRPGPRPALARGGEDGVLHQKSMPPMPPSPPGMAGADFSGLSATTASVVRNRPAMDAAFCRAERVTLVGSGMPALSMSSYSPVAALRP